MKLSCPLSMSLNICAFPSFLLSELPLQVSADLLAMLLIWFPAPSLRDIQEQEKQEAQSGVKEPEAPPVALPAPPVSGIGGSAAASGWSSQQAKPAPQGCSLRDIMKAESQAALKGAAGAHSADPKPQVVLPVGAAVSRCGTLQWLGAQSKRKQKSAA